MNPDSDNSITEKPRPFLTRTEIAILVGMVLCVASLFLTWRRQPVDAGLIHTMPTVMVVSIPRDQPMTGFEMPLRWPLTICAVFCGAGLLAQPKPQYRQRWMAAQIIAAAICLFLPILRFAMQPGVIVALLGGGLILFGVLERFGIGHTHQRKEED